MGRSRTERVREEKLLRTIHAAEAAAGRMPSEHALLGTQSFRWTTSAQVGVGVFALIFVVGLMMGYVLLPGGLLLGLVLQSTRPPRVVAVSRQGLTVWSKTIIGGRVKAPVHSIRIDQFGLDGGTIRIPRLPDIKLQASDARLFRQWLRDASGPAPAMPPPPVIAGARPVESPVGAPMGAGAGVTYDIPGYEPIKIG